MREMWRILRRDGRLVVVTTMDASLFESIALIPMAGSASIDAVQEASDWKHGSRVERVRTSEGGQVYYYSIRKLRSILVGSISAPVSKGSSSSDGKEGLFRDSIQLLLDEAMKAKEEMGAVADSQVLIMMEMEMMMIKLLPLMMMIMMMMEMEMMMMEMMMEMMMVFLFCSVIVRCANYRNMMKSSPRCRLDRHHHRLATTMMMMLLFKLLPECSW